MNVPSDFDNLVKASDNINEWKYKGLGLYRYDAMPHGFFELLVTKHKVAKDVRDLEFNNIPEDCLASLIFIGHQKPNTFIRKVLIDEKDISYCLQYANSGFDIRQI